ncbi:MAG: sialate O-acetylesterase [Lachnospiraceae bacterium]|nr:sialate O-acetylesterase [Lachnospiraceae bacterium]
MIRLPSNKKVIVILSALCCLLMVALNLYQKSRRTMDVILFMGQSNMSGANGDASQAPELIKGAGYEYRAITEPERLFVLEEPFGENEHREGALDDREILERRGTLATSFVNAYYGETGTPVAAVSASRGSSSLNGWLNKGLKEDAARRLEGAKECLKKEKIRIRHIYMVWFQGEADVNLKLTKEEYKEGLNALVSYMGEQGVEQCFLIQIGQDGENSEYHQAIMEAQLEICEEMEGITLASELPRELTGEDMTDNGRIHFTQKALNLIGEDAGAHAGKWVKALEKTESKR